MTLAWRTVTGNFNEALYAFIKQLEAPSVSDSPAA